MFLQEALKNVANFQFFGNENLLTTEISSITCDSRNVKENSLFICISGHTVDGHNFIKNSIDKGARFILIEKELDFYDKNTLYILVDNTNDILHTIACNFYNFPSKQLNMIGITGTNGKTTTSNIIEQIFNFNNISTGLIGTINIKYADKNIESVNTTPNSLDLQNILHDMTKHNVETVAMEVSSHALSLGRTNGISFNTAVFTNLTQDHLDFHEDMEDYALAKSLLFSQLSEDSTAIINIDDPMSDFFIKRNKGKLLTYGLSENADFQAKNIVFSPKGSNFDLVLPNGDSYSLSVNLIGKFNIYNILASIAVAVSYKINLNTIFEALSTIYGVNGRFESVDVGQKFSVIVDYAHTPDSLENVLNTANELSNGRIITVVGCGGDRDKTKRPIMAKIAQDYSDFVVITSDNPRTEDPLSILQDMEKGLDKENENYALILDRSEGINYAINKTFHLNENDCVIIVGKGHETYQIIGRTKNHFDDREHAKKYILS